MQDYFRSSHSFSQRTDALAENLGLFLKDLPSVLKISERMLFGYRSGKYPVTAKALRKLNAAEEAAGISTPATGTALNETHLKHPNSPDQKNDPFSDPRFLAMQAQLAAMQSQIQSAFADFSLGDLKARMSAAGAWPPSHEDLKLRPGDLIAKYPPLPKTSSKARGKSA